MWLLRSAKNWDTRLSCLLTGGFGKHSLPEKAIKLLVKSEIFLSQANYLLRREFESEVKSEKFRAFEQTFLFW